MKLRARARACTSREAQSFLALELVSFSTTAAYSFVSLPGGAIRFASLYENRICCPLYRHKDALDRREKYIYRHNFRPVHF